MIKPKKIFYLALLPCMALAQTAQNLEQSGKNSNSSTQPVQNNTPVIVNSTDLSKHSQWIKITPMALQQNDIPLNLVNDPPNNLAKSPTPVSNNLSNTHVVVHQIKTEPMFPASVNLSNNDNEAVPVQDNSDSSVENKLVDTFDTKNQNIPIPKGVSVITPAPTSVSNPAPVVTPVPNTAPNLPPPAIAPPDVPNLENSVTGLDKDALDTLKKIQQAEANPNSGNSKSLSSEHIIYITPKDGGTQGNVFEDAYYAKKQREEDEANSITPQISVGEIPKNSLNQDKELINKAPLVEEPPAQTSTTTDVVQQSPDTQPVVLQANTYKKDINNSIMTNTLDNRQVISMVDDLNNQFHFTYYSKVDLVYKIRQEGIFLVTDVIRKQDHKRLFTIKINSQTHISYTDAREPHGRFWQIPNQ